MAELMLEPYAARQRWTLPGADPDWRAFLEVYLRALAQACAAAGSPVIGHIKLLALLDGGAYFRASIVDAALPVTMEGELPSHLPSLDLTLNLIVYGLTQAAQKHITAEVSARLSAQYHGEVITTSGAHSHHSHP